MAVLNHFCDYAAAAQAPIETAAIPVTERYARRKLRLKRADPLVYRGLALRCIGSSRWRQEHLT